MNVLQCFSTTVLLHTSALRDDARCAGKMIQFHFISLKDDHNHSHGVTVLEKESAQLSPNIPAIGFTLTEEKSIEKLWCHYQTKKVIFIYLSM